MDWLGGRKPDRFAVRLQVEKPFRWVTPGLLRPGDAAPARGRLLLWTDDLVRIPRVLVKQDGRTVAQRRIPWPASPGRAFRLPWSLLSDVNPGGGDVVFGMFQCGRRHRTSTRDGDRALCLLGHGPCAYQRS
jgi:hypothetical protein